MPAMVNDFKFPSISIKPKSLPSKEELRIFFDALPDIKYRIIFLALASSGLRISELLNAEIDKGNPFDSSRNTIAHLFKEISNKTGINISAQTLRSIFAREMNLLAFLNKEDNFL